MEVGSAGILALRGLLLSWGVGSWPVAGRCHPRLTTCMFSVKYDVYRDQSEEKV